MRHRAAGWARWVSDHLTGAGAIIVAFVLALLAVLGNLTLVRDVFGVQIGTNVLVGVGVILFAANLLYRANRRVRDAEKERDDLRAALDARPDPAAERRLFLRLHDFGLQKVLPYFEAYLERMREQVPLGKKVYAEWVATCTETIEQYRPEYVLAFRQAQVVARRGGGIGRLVGYEDAEGKKVWVDLDDAEECKERVLQSCAVLAKIVEDRP